MYITVSETISVLIKFKVRGNLRFLSHAETVRVFQRACARAGIKIKYSQGFNPHPKLSLPLPRSVGVESDEDLLCLRIDGSTGDSYTLIKAELAEQLPEGLELLSIEVAKAKSTPQPCLVTYVFSAGLECLNDKLKDTIRRVLASDSLLVTRNPPDTKHKLKNVDVRPFLQSIKLEQRGIVVQSKVSSGGSIRVEEILKLLELDTAKLTAPIRRTAVQWQCN